MARYGTSKLFVALLALACLPAFAADDQAAPGMEAIMEAYMAYATPGEHHQHLAEQAGTWSTTVSSWGTPGSPPEVSQGTSERTLIMDGRYLLEKFTGETPWGPFQGMGLTGFDNIKQRYVATWIDSMSTGIMISESTEITDGRISYSGSSPEPMTGTYITIRSVETRVNDDTYRFEMFMPLPDGSEFKSMEIVYVRK